jgi:hypothetical protein
MVSDFEDTTRAMVLPVGNPTRNGYWYSYNDGSDGCAQDPLPGAVYLPGVSPPQAPPPRGYLSLHGLWTGCRTWGAGIGADFNVPATSGITYAGPKVPYDVSAFEGLGFIYRARLGSGAPTVRVRFPMRATTPVAEGGTCEADPTTLCGDDWGEDITLPNESWRSYVVRFSDAAFRQEGWGAAYPWNPADVIGIRIQSVEKDRDYDFWIDDVYLERKR